MSLKDQYRSVKVFHQIIFESKESNTYISSLHIEVRLNSAYSLKVRKKNFQELTKSARCPLREIREMVLRVMLLKYSIKRRYVPTTRLKAVLS